jgi:hypothetical protein
MNRGDAETLLRLLLGDSSSSIWSDTEIRTLLNRANVRMFRRSVMMHPNVALDKVGYSYGNDAEELSTGTDINSASVNQWITVERVFWKASGSSTYRELPIVQLDEMEELDAGSETTYDLDAIISALNPEAYYCVFRAGYDQIMVRPIPNKALTLRIYGTQDLSETALSASDTNLMGGNFAHMHEAVVHDAGYMATFKDQSLRDEFKLQREEILGLALEQPLVERRTN